MSKLTTSGLFKTLADGEEFDKRLLRWGIILVLVLNAFEGAALLIHLGITYALK